MNEDTDWWWIDYMEGELEPTTLPDIEFLLEKSPADRQNFESWQLLKSWVKEVDEASPSECLWSEAELSQLKLKTMSSLPSKSKGACQSSEVSLRV